MCDCVPIEARRAQHAIERGVTELFFYALDDNHVSAECIAVVYSAME